MTAAALLAILNEILALEPAALALVTKLIDGLKGQSDATVLAADSSQWATILAAAKAAQAGK